MTLGTDNINTNLMSNRTRKRTFLTRDILGEMVWAATHIKGAPLSADYLADLFECTTRHARRIKENESDITAVQFVRLASVLAEQGDFRFIEILLPVGMTVTKLNDVQTNASLDDEYADDTELKGKVRELYRQGKNQEALDLYREGQAEINSRIEKELKEKIHNGR